MKNKRTFSISRAQKNSFLCRGEKTTLEKGTLLLAAMLLATIIGLYAQERPRIIVGREPTFWYGDDLAADSIMYRDVSYLPDAGEAELAYYCSVRDSMPVIGIAIAGYRWGVNGSIGPYHLNLYDKHLGELAETAPFMLTDTTAYLRKYIRRSLPGGVYEFEVKDFPLYEAYFDSTYMMQGGFFVGFDTSMHMLVGVNRDFANYRNPEEAELPGGRYHTLLCYRFPGSKWMHSPNSGSTRFPMIFPIVDTSRYTWPSPPAKCDDLMDVRVRKVIERDERYGDTTTSVYHDLVWELPDGVTGAFMYDTITNHPDDGNTAYGQWWGYKEPAISWRFLLQDFPYHHEVTLQSAGNFMECAFGNEMAPIELWDGMPVDEIDTIVYADPPVVGVEAPDQGREDPDLLAEMTYVRPNPAQNEVTIASSFGLRSVSLYDMQGTRVLYKKLSGYAETVDLTQLPSGLYVVMIATPAGPVTKMLAKE